MTPVGSGAPLGSAMLELVVGLYGARAPVMPNFGKVIVALLIFTRSWLTGPAGS